MWGCPEQGGKEQWEGDGMERKGDGTGEKVAWKGRSIGRLQTSMKDRAWDTHGRTVTLEHMLQGSKRQKVRSER